MRTTLTLDADVADLAQAAAKTTGRAFKDIINDALRSGLPELQKPTVLPPYRTQPRHMGLRPGISLDNVQELLSRIEGENAR